MPPSAGEKDFCAGQALAVTAEALYLTNLLLLPGLAFIILLFVYFRNKAHASPLALNHLRQTVSASLWAGIALVVVNGLIIFIGGYASAHTWVAVGLYFTTVHAAFVVFGMLGLAKAMACKTFRFPMLGRD